MTNNALVKIIEAAIWGPRHNILPMVVALNANFAFFGSYYIMHPQANMLYNDA